MIANDGNGNMTGYQAGKKIELVRNPSWDKDTDYRPAYLDKIDVRGRQRRHRRQPPDPDRAAD